MGVYKSVLNTDLSTEDVFGRLIGQESGGNPNAVGRMTRYGQAKGLGQLLDTTGQEELALISPGEKYDPFNPEQNLKVSKSYYTKLYDKYQDHEKALMAYNWGPGNVDNWLGSGAKYNEIPPETKNYVDSILGGDNLKNFGKKGLYKSVNSGGLYTSVSTEHAFKPSDVNTSDTEDVSTNQQSLFTNIGHSILQGWDQGQLSNAEDNYNSAFETISKYNKAVREKDFKVQNELFPQLAKANEDLKSAEEDINTNLQEIQKNPVSNAYLFKEQLSNAQGSKASLIDKLAYEQPQSLGSSLPLMLPNIVAEWGSPLIQKAIATGLTELTLPDPLVSKIAGGATLIGAGIAGVVSAYGESKQERSQAVSTAKEALFQQWMKNHPGVDFNSLSSEDQQAVTEDIHLQAMKGTDKQFTEDLVGLSIENMISNTFFVGSGLPGIIGDTFKTAKELGTYYRKLTNATKLSRLAAGVAEKYAGVYLPEKWEEGFEYGTQQRQFDTALGTNLYENEGLMKDFLSDSYDTIKSMNYSPFGVIRNENGRYSMDPQFQTSEEAGGLMSLLFGGLPSAISIGSDLLTYRKYNKLLSSVSPFIKDNEKSSTLKNAVYFDAFENNNVHHLIEGLKTLKSTKDKDGKQLLSDEEYNNEIQEVKKAYDKYDIIGSYVDDLFIGRTGKENKSLKRTIKGIVFDTSLKSAEAGADFDKSSVAFETGLASLKGTLRQNENLGVQYKQEVAKQLLDRLEGDIKENPGASVLYDLNKKKDALGKYMKELDEEAKGYTRVKKIPNMTPEFRKSTQDYVVNKVIKDTSDSIYDDVLGLKSIDDISKYLEKLGRKTEKKKKIIEEITQKNKEDKQKAKDEAQNKPDLTPEDNTESTGQEDNTLNIPEDKTENTPQTGTIQKTGTTEEVPFIAKRNKDGIEEFDIKNPDGSTRTVNNTEGWYQSFINEPRSDKEELNSKTHFSDMFTYNLLREKSKLKEIARFRAIKARQEAGLPEVNNLEPSKEELESVYEEYQGTNLFTALKSRRTLDRIMQRPDWKDYIKLVANTSFTGKKQQTEHRVVFENKGIGLRGVRKQGIDILMEITDPETGEVSRMNHPMNPDFYEYHTVDKLGKQTSDWAKWDFLSMPFSEFDKRFSFQFGDDTNKEAKRRDWEDLKENYRNLVEFERKVKNAYQGTEMEIPQDWYSLTPSANLDWLSKDAKDINIEDIPLMEKAPIVFLAGSKLFDISTEKRPEGFLPPDTDKHRGSYMAFIQAPNGGYKWVRIYPKSVITKADQEEHLGRIISLRDEAHELDNSNENSSDILEGINTRVPIFIKDSGIYRVILEAGFPTERKTDNLFTTAELRAVVLKDGKRIGMQYMDDSTTLSNWQDLLKFLNSVPVPQGEVYNINPDQIRRNLPKDAFEVPNVQRNFVSSVKPNVFKTWTVKFNFDSKKIVTPPVTKTEVKKPADIVPVTEKEIKTPSDIVRNLMEKHGVPQEEAEKIAAEQERLLNENPEDSSPFSFIPIGDIQTIEQAKEYIKTKLPSSISIDDINLIYNKLNANKIPLGTVINRVIYVNSQHNKGVLYHEAFHAVFRNLLSDARIQAFLNRAKQEMNLNPEQLQDKMDEVRNASDNYKGLSNKEIEELVYEEYLADEYSHFVLDDAREKRSWLRQLFDKIKAFFNWITGNPDVHSLFERIDNGAFSTSSLKVNRYTIQGSVSYPYKLIKGLSAHESKEAVNRVVGTYLAARQAGTPRITLDAVITDLISFYNPYLQGNIEHLKTVSNPGFVRQEMNRFFTSLSLEGDSKTPSTRALLKTEANRILRKIKANPLEEEQEIQESIEDNGIQFDISENQRKPSDRTTRRVKEFLSTILYSDIDPITKKEYQRSVSWEDMYNRLLVLLNLDSIKDINRVPEVLKAVSIYSTQLNAVYQALKTKVGLENESITDPDFLTEFKNAFKLRQALFGNIIAGKTKRSLNDSAFFIVNKGDLGREKVSQWKDIYVKQSAVLSTNKELRNTLINQIDDLIGRISGRPDFFTGLNSVDLARQIFNTVGIDLQQMYLEFSFGKDEELKNSLKDRKPISKKDLLDLKSSISNGTNFFDKNVKTIRKIADNDAVFDDNMILKSYTNAEGKSQYSYVTSNLIYDKVSDFKTDLSTKQGIASLKKDLYSSYIPIVNSPDANKTFGNLQVVLTGNSQNTNKENGTSMKHSDKLSYTVMQHALFNAKENVDNQELAYYWITQIGEKNTQLAGRLPERLYYKDGLTSQAKDDLLSLVKQQIDRVQGKFGDKFTTKGHLLFPFLNETRFQGSFEDNKDSILNTLDVIVSGMIDSHMQYLDQNKLWDYIKDEGLSKYNNDKREYVGNFILNDFINSTSLLQMIGGDMAWAKSWEDFVKRAGALIASGQDFGDGISTLSMMQDTVIYLDTKNNWVPVTKEVFKTNPERYVELKVDDAQTYSTDIQKLKDLTQLGRIDDITKEKLKYLSNPIDENGNYKPEYLNPVDSKHKVDMISSKQVVRGKALGGEEVYLKTTVFYISRELGSKYDKRDKTWKPLRGLEKFHNMYEYLTRNNVNFLAPKSAYKLYFGESSAESSRFYGTSDVKTVNVQISDRYRRLQVELDTKNSTKIPVTNQELNIMGSELSTAEGKQARQKQINVLNTIKQRIFDDIKKIFQGNDLSNLYNSVQNALEEHTGDSQMVQFLETVNGQPKYDTNLLHISSKLEEIFFSKFKDAFKTKVSGRKLTHVSPEGFTVLYDKETKEVIPRELERLDPLKYQDVNKYGTRELAFGEILMPKKWGALQKLLPTDPMFKKLFDIMVGKRIPTQSYHSLDGIKVVDTLPDYYGDIVVAHKEIYALMGADNDADALYTYMKAWYQDSNGNIRVYGEEQTDTEKYEAYITDLFDNNYDLKRVLNEMTQQNAPYQEVKAELDQLADELKSQQKRFKESIKEIGTQLDDLIDEDKTNADHELLWLKKDVGAIRNYLGKIKGKYDILGDFPDELNQKIMDLMEGIIAGKNYNRANALRAFGYPNSIEEWKTQGSPEALSSLENKYIQETADLLKLPELQEANNSPLSTEPIKKSLAYLNKIQGPEYKENYLPNSIPAKQDAYEKQFLSKGQVGVAVNGNSMVQYLTEHKISLDEDFTVTLNGKTYTTFESNKTNSREKFHINSSILGGIVDSAKDPVAHKFNWSLETLVPRVLLGSISTAQGEMVSAQDADLFIMQPALQELNKVSQNGKSQFSSTSSYGAVNDALNKTHQQFYGLRKAIFDSTLSDKEKQDLELMHDRYADGTLNTEDMEFSLAQDGVPESLEQQIRYHGTQYQVVRVFSNLNDVTNSLRETLTRILRTNRTMGKSTVESDMLLKSFETLDEEFTPLNGLRDSVHKNVLLNGNKARLNDTRKTLERFFIKLNPYFKEFKKLLEQSQSKVDADLDNDLITFFSMQIIRKSLLARDKDPLKMTKELLTGDNSLGKRLVKYKTPSTLENPFVKYIRSLGPRTTMNRSNIQMVAADSRTKLSAESTDLLINGFTELLHKDKALADDLLLYLLVKDNLRFADQSFIKYVVPSMFVQLSNSLSKFNQALQGTPDEARILELTGRSTNQLKSEFIKLYGEYALKTEFIKTFSKADLKVNVGSREDKNEVQVVDYNYQDSKIFLKLNDKILDNERALKRFKRLKIQDGVVTFPVLIRGIKAHKGVYARTKYDETSAEYTKLASVDVKGVQPWLLGHQYKDFSKTVTPVQQAEDTTGLRSWEKQTPKFEEIEAVPEGYFDDDTDDLFNKPSEAIPSSLESTSQGETTLDTPEKRSSSKEAVMKPEKGLNEMELAIQEAEKKAIESEIEHLRLTYIDLPLNMSQKEADEILEKIYDLGDEKLSAKYEKDVNTISDYEKAKKIQAKFGHILGDADGDRDVESIDQEALEAALVLQSEDNLLEVFSFESLIKEIENDTLEDEFKQQGIDLLKKYNLYRFIDYNPNQLRLFENKLTDEAYGTKNSITLNGINAQYNFLQKIFAQKGVQVNLVPDKNIEGALITEENGEVTIKFNPDKTTGRDIPHEFFHLLLNSLGYNHPVVQQGIALAKSKRPDVWAQVQDIYSHRSKEEQEKELLTQLVGNEADKYSTQDMGWFKYWLNKIFRAIKELFGFPVDTIRQFYEDLVSGNFDLNENMLTPEGEDISNTFESKSTIKISDSLKKDINDLRQHLMSRIEELRGISSSNTVAQSRLKTVLANLEKVTKQANYDVIINTASSEIQAAGKLLDNPDASKLHEVLNIVSQYKNFHQFINSREITDDQKERVKALNEDITSVINKFNKTEEEFVFNKSKIQGQKFTKEEFFKPKEDISEWTRGNLSPRETDIPLSNLMYDTIRSMKRRISNLWRDIDTKAKKIRESLPKDWISTIFDRNGNLVTPIDSQYFTEEQDIKDRTNAIIESYYKGTGATKAQRNAAYQQKFIWDRDNNKFFYSDESEAEYKADEAEAKASFTDENGNVDTELFTDWVYANKPMTGKLNTKTREMEMTGVSKVYMNNKRANSGWQKYLDAVPVDKWKNPQYQNVKDLEYYQFIIQMMTDGISKMPKESLKDETSYFRYINSVRLDLSSNKFKLSETWGDMQDTFKDWFAANITASDLNLMKNAVLDEKGVRKPSIKLRTLKGIQQEDYIKDPFDIVLNFYKGAIAFEQKVQAEPGLILLQHSLENQPSIRTNITGRMFQTVLSGSETHPELVKQGLINAGLQTKYQLEAELYNKTRRDNPKVSLTPQEQKKLNEETAQWIKDGMIGEPPTVSKLTVDRIADSIVDYTRILTLGGGLYSGINNLLMGLSSNYMYAAREKEFTAEELDWATGILFQSVVKFWFGGKIVTKAAKKTTNLAMKFGVFKNTYEGQGENRPELLRKAVEILMTPQESGENLIHSQIMLAMMKHTKVIDLKGKERTLYDAFDEEGNWKTAEFGDSPEWEKQEVFNSEGVNVSKIKQFEDTLSNLRIDTQGDYTNRLMSKATWKMRVLYLFRTWIPKSLDQRFGKQRGDDFKGRYRSYRDIKNQLEAWGLWKMLGLTLGGGVLKVLNVPFGIGKYTGLKAVSNLGIDKIEDFMKEHQVSELDIENFRANLKELQMTMYFLALGIALSNGGDDDDFALNYMGNVTYRMYQDLTFFYYPNSFMGIIKDPIPITSTVFNSGKVIYDMWQLMLEPRKDRIRRGIWKGDSRTLHDLAKVVPLWRQVNSTYSLGNQIFGSDSWKYTKK